MNTAELGEQLIRFCKNQEEEHGAIFQICALAFQVDDSGQMVKQELLTTFGLSHRAVVECARTMLDMVLHGSQISSSDKETLQ